MTMPHLSNCEHSESGWCVDCVKELWKNKEKLIDAISHHKQQKGHERCWENDEALYRIANLIEDEDSPTIQEHRRRCDEYRADIYDGDVILEPYLKNKILSYVLERVLFYIKTDPNQRIFPYYRSSVSGFLYENIDGAGSISGVQFQFFDNSLSLNGKTHEVSIKDILKEEYPKRQKDEDEEL